jgi:ribonuclease P protein component
MLPKKNRLKKQEVIEVLRNSESFISTGSIDYKIKKNKLGYLRCAVIISSKIVHQAVDRVKIKRSLINSLESNHILMSKGIDLVLHLKKELTAKKEFFISEKIEEWSMIN